MINVKVKRVYDSSHPSDGKRILVDRLWPRGLTKEQVAVDIWMKEIAPSNDLRKQYNHKPELFEEFTEKYLIELQQESQVQLLQQIREWASADPVTLVYAARDEVHNHAVFLKEVILGGRGTFHLSL